MRSCSSQHAMLDVHYEKYIGIHDVSLKMNVVSEGEQVKSVDFSIPVISHRKQRVNLDHVKTFA